MPQGLRSGRIDTSVSAFSTPPLSWEPAVNTAGKKGREVAEAGTAVS